MVVYKEQDVPTSHTKTCLLLTCLHLKEDCVICKVAPPSHQPRFWLKKKKESAIVNKNKLIYIFCAKEINTFHQIQNLVKLGTLHFLAITPMEIQSFLGASNLTFTAYSFKPILMSNKSI